MMFRYSVGGILLGGLSLMLFSKAAVSFPILPLFSSGAFPDEMVVLAAAETETEVQGENAPPPPLVANLPANTESCTAPEELLRSIANERTLLLDQRGELEKRKSELALAKETLEIEKNALGELKDSIEMLLAKVEASQTDDLSRLVEFYRNMKPADAARIMDDMDIETTIMILGTMKPRNAAPIMAKMSPIRTRAVSKIIFERSQLPGDQDLVGIRLK